MPRMQVASSAQASTVATASTRRRVASSPSAARVVASIGTKAWANAPSANSRRSRFGMRKAIWNASIIAEVPNRAAPICSRTRPVTRDASVSAETEKAALNRFIGRVARRAGSSPPVPAGADYRQAPRQGPVPGQRNCYTSQSCPVPGPQPNHRTTMATASKAKKKTVRLASGRKRARQDVKLNAANTALRSKFRTVVKNVQKAVTAGDKAKAAGLFTSAQSVIDSVADKGIFHKNKAARHKSRLSAKIKAMAAAA
jgi:small subunit ribosomal protein S20